MSRISATEVLGSLSEAMREGSRVEHEAAENSAFMAELLDGRVNEQGYIDYLKRLRMVYAALEDVVRTHREDRLVAAVYDPALERTPAIDADLRHWAPGTSHEVDSAAAQAYQERLRGLDWGGAVVAHHYTRYLGDLSGGQAIGKILDRTFGLEGAGLTFYHFSMRAKPYKDGYRARLDELHLDADDTARVVVEVKLAFGLNQALFAELGQNLSAYRR